MRLTQFKCMDKDKVSLFGSCIKSQLMLYLLLEYLLQFTSLLLLSRMLLHFEQIFILKSPRTLLVFQPSPHILLQI